MSLFAFQNLGILQPTPCCLSFSHKHSNATSSHWLSDNYELMCVLIYSHPFKTYKNTQKDRILFKDTVSHDLKFQVFQFPFWWEFFLELFPQVKEWEETLRQQNILKSTKESSQENTFMLINYWLNFLQISPAHLQYLEFDTLLEASGCRTWRTCSCPSVQRQKVFPAPASISAYNFWFNCTHRHPLSKRHFLWHLMHTHEAACANINPQAVNMFNSVYRYAAIHWSLNGL